MDIDGQNLKPTWLSLKAPARLFILSISLVSCPTDALTEDLDTLA
jgi:hypothetical protein